MQVNFPSISILYYILRFRSHSHVSDIVFIVYNFDCQFKQIDVYIKIRWKERRNFTWWNHFFRMIPCSSGKPSNVAFSIFNILHTIHATEVNSRKMLLLLLLKNWHKVPSVHLPLCILFLLSISFELCVIFFLAFLHCDSLFKYLFFC